MKNKKTIREHLNDLPEPYRTEALANNTEDFDWDEIKEDSVRDAILGAFKWNYTPQGFEYWEKFYETL